MEDPTENLLACGSYGSGKSEAAARKVVLLCDLAPYLGKVRIALIRKKRKQVKATLWRRVLEVMPPNWIRGIDRSNLIAHIKPPHGQITEIVATGLDSSGTDINPLASEEFSHMFAEEATEISFEEYNEKIRRCLRLPGAKHHQIMSLCNAGAPSSWIYEKFYLERDPAFKVIEGQTIPESCGVLPASYYEYLRSLPGVYGLRYRENRWIAIEGLVYPFNPKEQYLSVEEWQARGFPWPIPASWRCVQANDFGFDHPFVYQWWRVSPSDVWVLVAQIYKSMRVVEDHAVQIRDVSRGMGFRPYTFCDHDAEDAATLRKHGVATRNAFKDRRWGQQAVYKRFPHTDPANPEELTDCRVYFLKDSLLEVDYARKVAGLPTRTVEEFPTYVWQKGAGREDMSKEKDDGCDTMRMAMATHDKLTATPGGTAAADDTRYSYDKEV